MFQSDGHFEMSIWKPLAPTYRFLLEASWPYLPEPAAGITSPWAPAAAVVVAPPAAAVVVPAAAVVAGAAVVAPLLPLLLSPPHAAATMPSETSSAVGATHRFLLISWYSPWWLFGLFGSCAGGRASDGTVLGWPLLEPRNQSVLAVVLVVVRSSADGSVTS